MGLCIPTECDQADLSTIFDKLYFQGLKYTGIIKTPKAPQYSFPIET